ncbi:TIGR04372 family glycosyltransferase [uncultured Pseudodesulfovibrio sp.]|uniref:TIGR04372 family glycosyltransferase n=1 Tax=uncultured Pseudodesulfovibrio sp. TaxID=2035858 RepID=UPI0029C90D8E|nr:TIGR04372 family glycosyltransferase [uncultured Pseudodesulfovibrio sp.]
MASQPKYRINLRPYRILYWPVFLPVALLLALFNRISPIPFKIYNIRVDRIGQMAANQEEFFCQLELGMLPKEFRIFVHRDHPSNRALLNILKRSMRINQLFLPLFDVCRKLGGLGVSSMELCQMHGDDAMQLAAEASQHVDFTQAETDEAKRQCQAIGIDPDKPFIPTLCRDSSYLSSLKEPTDEDSYRNSDINTFIPALEHLADNFQVLRVGSVVEGPLNTQHPNIIDYSLSGNRTELLDVYLAAKCHFFLSTGTGLDTITSCLFRKPVLYVNLTPVGAVYMFKPWTMFIPKKYFDQKKDRYLTLSEILESGVAEYYTPRELNPLGIVIHDNTPEEITEAVKEMTARLDGTWEETEEDRALHEKFWSHFKKQHPKLKYTVRVGTSFIRNNPSWLE